MHTLVYNKHHIYISLYICIYIFFTLTASCLHVAVFWVSMISTVSRFVCLPIRNLHRPAWNLSRLPFPSDELNIFFLQPIEMMIPFLSPSNLSFYPNTILQLWSFRCHVLLKCQYHIIITHTHIVWKGRHKSVLFML